MIETHHRQIGLAIRVIRVFVKSCIRLKMTTVELSTTIAIQRSAFKIKHRLELRSHSMRSIGCIGMVGRALGWLEELILIYGDFKLKLSRCGADRNKCGNEKSN